MQTLVSTIRATGATNVVALGGVQWSNTFTRWLQYKPSDPLNNLVGSWHDYNWTWCVTAACWDSNVGTFAAQVPVIADEVGDDQCNAAWYTSLLSWLDGKQIGYLGWTWNVWGAGCSNIALINDYTGTPTTYGLIFKNFMALHAGTASEPTVVAASAPAEPAAPGTLPLGLVLSAMATERARRPRRREPRSRTPLP
jgi:hypothetical protein